MVRRAKRPEDAAKYKALSDHLKPDSLGDKITSYVLPEQWSALDIAEIDFEDDKRYEKAGVLAQAACADIGRQLAGDSVALAHHLPILLRCKSSRVWTVFSALAETANDPLATWRVISQAFAQIPAAEREDQSLCGYVAASAKADTERAEAILDEALADVELHASLARMHMAVGVNARGAERLIRAIAIPTVPTWSFGNLRIGRACDKLNGAQFRPLLAALCERDDGFSTAIGIMGQRVYSRKDDKQALDADDKAAGRDLLARLPLTEGRNTEAEDVGRIARACLTPADGLVAEQICNRIREGFGTYTLNSRDYRKLIEALALIFPTTVLDILVERGGSPYEGRRGLFYSYQEAQSGPLDKIPADTFIEWAKSGPEERFAYLAETIRVWTNPDGTPNEEEPGSLVWTPVARRLIAEAPDPLPVLSIIFERFNSSGWSGSLADILASRLPLLVQLESDVNPAVAAWAMRVRPIHEANVQKSREWEARESRDRDERFEW